MKKVFTLLFALILSFTTFAQSPEAFSYQAVVRNSNGELVASSNIGVRISILEGSSSGYSVYTETFNEQTTSDGLLNLVLGMGNSINGNFNDINWGNSTKFIQVETDINGGQNYSVVGTSQLLSVPYALHAKTAESIDNVYNKQEVDGKIANFKTEEQINTIVDNSIFNNIDNKLNLKADKNSIYTRSEVDNKLNSKVNTNSVYSKTEIDNELILLAKTNDVYNKNTINSKFGNHYTKDEVNTKLAGKSNSGESYTKVEANTNLSKKADIGVSYTKNEANTELAKKADLSSVYSKTDLSSKGKSSVNFSNITNLPVNLDINANDDVKTSGDQVIGGIKRFENTIVLTAGISAGGTKISNVASPTLPKDVATKEYVDNLLIKFGDTKKLIEANIFTIVQLYDGGHSVQNLKDAGVPDQILAKLLPPESDGNGVSNSAKRDAIVVELINAGINTNLVYEYKFMVGTLEKLGATTEALVAANLIGQIVDINGNSYKWVKIGDNKWMAENLKNTKYADATDISNEEQFVYDNNLDNANNYGRLYTYNVVKNDANVCPTGWHVATNKDWDDLSSFLGKTVNIGSEIITSSSNESGFSAIMSGHKFNDKFSFKDTRGYLWLKDRNIIIYDNNLKSIKIVDSNTLGASKQAYSVRCVSK